MPKPVPQIYVVPVDEPERAGWIETDQDQYVMFDDITALDFEGDYRIEETWGFEGIVIHPQEGLGAVSWYAMLAHFYGSWAARLLPKVDEDMLKAYEVLRSGNLGEWRNIVDYVKNHLLMNEGVSEDELDQHNVSDLAVGLVASRRVIVFETEKGVQIFRTDGVRRGHRLDQFAV